MKQLTLASVLAPLRDFRRTWPQLLLTDLLTRALAVVVLIPLVGLLLKLFLLTTETGVLTDEGILAFLVHPVGVLALVIVGAVSLGLLFAEVGVLMVIGFGATEDRRVTYLDAIRYVALRAPRLVQLAGALIVRLLLLSLPFLAGLGAVYLLFLRRHDINFYLAQKPPEFWWAVAVGGLLLAALAILIVQRIAVWVLSLPIVLFGEDGGRRALRASARETAGDRVPITLWLAGWVVATALTSALVSWVVGLAGNALVPRNLDNVPLMAAGLAAVLLLSGLGTLIVSILSTALFPLFLVRLYRSMAGPGALEPEIAARGSLAAHASVRIPGKLILGGIALALLVVTLAGYLAMQRLGPADRTAIIAHRGASGGAPENTLAAFELAIAEGADWIELDVQENADGVVVVEHDSDFMRVAGVDLKVWDATDADLRDLDVGSFFAPEFADQRVPTLREVLELARGNLGVFIELKYYGHDRNLEAKVVDLVESTGMVSDIVVMSLEYDGVRKMAGLRPDWTYGLLNTVSVGNLTRLKLDFLALNASAATRAMIRRAHKRGMKVYAWTVDDPVQMAVMMSRGVDGIITNEPARARQVKDLRDQLTPFGRLVVWIAGETGLLHGDEEVSVENDA